MTRPAILRALREWFEGADRGAAAVYVFGSVARETAGADSDVDVGVLFTRAPGPTLLDQPYDMADALGRVVQRPVDLVVLNTAPPDLRMRVLRDGELVFEGDASTRVRFEIATRNEAFDLEPILREYRRPRASA